MPRNRTTLLLLFALVGSLSLQAQNTLLKLRNGDQLTGKVVSESSTNLLLEMPWGASVSIPLTQITNRTVVATNVVTAVVQLPKTNPPVVAVKPVPSKTPPKPSRQWHGDVQVGTDLGFSEKNRQLYYARFKINYAHRTFRTVFDYNGSYGRTDGIVSANRMDGSAKTDFDVSEKWYVYNLAGAGYDDIRKIEMRYEIGPGVGYHLITRTNYNVNLEAGINFQSQTFKDGTENEHLYFRLAEIVTWRFSKRLSMDEKFEYFPRVEDPSEFRLRFETNLRYWLSDMLSFNLTVLDLYDTAPARSVSRNDLQIRSSIGIKF